MFELQISVQRFKRIVLLIRERLSSPSSLIFRPSLPVQWKPRTWNLSGEDRTLLGLLARPLAARTLSAPSCSPARGSAVASKDLRLASGASATCGDRRRCVWREGRAQCEWRVCAPRGNPRAERAAAGAARGRPGSGVCRSQRSGKTQLGCLHWERGGGGSG